MVRSPKSRTNHHSNKKRRHSSTSDSDDDTHHQRSREDNRSTVKSSSDVRIKEEPITDPESRRPHHHSSGFPLQHKSSQRRMNNNNEEKSYQWGKRTDDKSKVKEEVPIEKEQPNFGLSGALLKDTNVYRGVVIKYSEPLEARKPKRRWRLYVFKGDQELPMYQIHRQSAYLIGRERGICDLPIDHPSCSKQHAVLQYRLIDYKRDDGTMGRRVLPYLIDLGSANGTFINNKRLESQRYYELRENDVIKFAFSTREYVLLHEDSATGMIKDDDDNDDDDDEIDAKVKHEPEEIEEKNK